MQIQANTTQRNSLNFGSKFVRTKDLRRAFAEVKNYGEIEERRQFANAVKGILNDGKDDVIRVSSQNSEGRIQVNGKLYNKDKRHWINWNKSQEGTRNELIEFAENEKGIARVFKHNSLSKDEANAIKDVVKELRELNPSSKNFISDIGQLQLKMKSKLQDFITLELKRLEKEIFSIKKNQNAICETQQSLKKPPFKVALKLGGGGNSSPIKQLIFNKNLHF